MATCNNANAYEFDSCGVHTTRLEWQRDGASHGHRRGGRGAAGSIGRAARSPAGILERLRVAGGWPQPVRQQDIGPARIGAPAHTRAFAATVYFYQRQAGRRQLQRQVGRAGRGRRHARNTTRPNGGVSGNGGPKFRVADDHVPVRGLRDQLHWKHISRIDQRGAHRAACQRE